MDKPTLTPPELRRKKSEIDGRLRVKEEESSRTLAEASEGDKLVPDDVWTKLDGLTAEILGLRKQSEAFRTQVEAAERWEAVDNAIANGEGRGRLNRDEPTLPHNDARNTRNGRLQYSVLKALRHLADPQKHKLDGIEAEVTVEMAKIPRGQGSMRHTYGSGISIPIDLPVDLRSSMRWAEKSGVSGRQISEMRQSRAELARLQAEARALDTTAGAGSIPTILDTTMIEILRARMVTYGLGAKFLTDMQGLFAIPRQATASTFYMVGQGVSVTASNQTIEQVPFSPHTGGVNTQYTRQFLEQTNQDAEMFVREDQAAVVARGVETAALNGQGAGGYPLGILQNPQVGIFPLGTNGAAPTWTQIVSMEAYVSYFNADVGSLAYVTDALIRGTLKVVAKIGSTFPIFLWNTEAPDFPVNGYPCGITNLLPQNLTKGTGTNLHAMTFGNWEDLIYAFWSGMDVIVDPYTSASQGAVNIITLQDFDCNLRHYQSFANCVDIISSITAPVI